MHLTNKNTCAPTPPMGWNSYDYYDTTGTTYVALFNLSDAPQTVSSTLADADCPLESVAAKELWSGKACPARNQNNGFSSGQGIFMLYSYRAISFRSRFIIRFSSREI